MHDSVWFEINKKPAVVIASNEFVDAAERQAEALGLPELRRVFVPHPIQDQTRAEIEAKADAVLGELIARLTN